MSLDSNRRPPWAIFLLIGTVLSFPFFLLALALSPLSAIWARFLVPALPFTALLLLLWLWLRDRRSAGPKVAVNVLAQEAYPPGA
jgi:hypothetical protein